MAVLPTAAVGACAAFFAWYPICDGDIFWHLAAGREIVKNGAVPLVDPFAFTINNCRWIDLHWLYQVFMYALHSFTGTKGLLLANSILFGGAAAIAFTIVKGRGGAWILVPLWIAALYEVRYLVPHRPIVFTLVFMAIFFVCLERFNQSGRFRFLWALIPVQIAWVNCQGLFLLGPAIFAAYFFGETVSWVINRVTGGFFHYSPRLSAKTVRMVALSGCALFAAGIVNPYGIHAFELAARLFTRTDPSFDNLYSVNIVENTPLFRLIGTGQAQYVYGVAAITWIALMLIAVRPRAVRCSYCFVSLAMLVLAVRAQRNIVLYYFALLPFISWMAAEIMAWSASGRGTRVKPFAIAAAGICTLLSVFEIGSHAVVLYNAQSVGDIAPFSFPAASVEYLRTHTVKGNIFNADRYGGYLLWKLFPDRKVFVDTRYSIRPPEFFAGYLAILDTPALFEQVCEKFSIRTAILPMALTDRYYTLARALLAKPEWRLVHADGAEALFIRDSAGEVPALALGSVKTVDFLTKEVQKRWRGNPALRAEATQNLAAFFSQMGFQEGANRVVSLGNLGGGIVSNCLNYSE